MSRRQDLGVACAAAVVATVGDLLMLLVANSLRPDLQLPRPPELALAVGGLLGVGAIPLYALGYRAVARAVRPASRGQAWVILACGTATAALGALIHGLTALSIRAAIASGSASGSPAEAVAASGGSLLAAWGVAALLVLAASIAIFAAGASPGRGLPRWASWLNPAATTLLLGMAGLPWEAGRSFLLPAAPNLGHVVFFCSCFYAFGRSGPGSR